MRILIASKTLTITQALRAFAIEQASKLQKLHQRIGKVQISLDHKVTGSKRDQNAIIKYVVSLPGKTIVVRTMASDMYEGIVDATNAAMRQVRKMKEKQIQFSRKSLSH